MNRMDKLIAELCPDGVEYKELSSITKITTGKLNANAMKSDGLYPFFTCSEKPYLIDNYAFDTEAILISGNGSQLGHINYFHGKFNAYQRTYVLYDFSKSISTSYLIHYLKGYLREYIWKNVKEGSVPYITLPMLQNFILPIPPLPIQQEIVRILDTFTDLDAELQAELEARKKQYGHYRDQLLNFEGKEVEWKTLGEVCLKAEIINWKESKTTDYLYIDLTSVSREDNKITDSQTVNFKNAPSRARQIVLKGDVIFGSTRPTLKRVSIIPKIYHKQICSTGFCVLRANQEIILSKYLYFVLKTSSYNSYVEIHQEGASYPSISDNKIKQFKIHIPPLSEQERIVSILDKFEALVNVELPAEIATRRKQYEYYREKLLTFERLVI